MIHAMKQMKFTLSIWSAILLTDIYIYIFILQNSDENTYDH